MTNTANEESQGRNLGTSPKKNNKGIVFYTFDKGDCKVIQIILPRVLWVRNLIKINI